MDEIGQIVEASCAVSAIRKTNNRATSSYECYCMGWRGGLVGFIALPAYANNFYDCQYTLLMLVYSTFCWWIIQIQIC